MKIVMALPTDTKIFAMCAWFSLAACTTSTQPSASVAGVDPKPAPIINFQIVDGNGLYRGGQPASKNDWEFLKKAKIKTVIKLNKYSSTSGDKEEALAREYGIEKFIPILMQPEDWPHNWNSWATPTNGQIVDALIVLCY